MKTLIIHPKDPTTDFLNPIHEAFPDATLATGDLTRSEVNWLIGEHSRIVMMGHGSPNGLFGVGRFYNDDGTTCSHIIGRPTVSLLQGKQLVSIWCYASSFMSSMGLKGFSTGMFISEMGEARLHGVECTREQLDESNASFARICRDAWFEYPFEHACDLVVSRYYHEAMYQNNPVIDYNAKRLLINI